MYTTTVWKLYSGKYTCLNRQQTSKVGSYKSKVCEEWYSNLMLGGKGTLVPSVSISTASTTEAPSKLSNLLSVLCRIRITTLDYNRHVHTCTVVLYRTFVSKII